jgi:ElaB/YqjD/DUF883 family membrane-anchored ribosome-binding protein
MEPKNTQEKGGTQGTQTGNNPGQTGSQLGTSTRGGQPSSQSTGTGTATARQQTTGRSSEQHGQEEWNDVKERGAEIADKAKQTFNEAYERTSRTLNDSYERAIDYGSENPGRAMLIAFGVGVGFGLWLSSNVSSRSRSSRIVPPVINALSEIAAEMFR